MQTLQNHLQELANITIDSEWLKGLVDLGSGAVKTVTGLTKAFGGLNSIIGAIAGYFLQKNGFGLASFDKVSGKWVSLIGRIRQSNSIFKESKASIDQFTSSFGKGKMVSELINPESPLGIGKQLKAYGIDSGFREYIKNMTDAERATTSLGEAQQKYLASLSVGTKIAKGFGSIITSVLSTAGTMLISMAASWLVSKGIGAISNLINKRKNTVKAGEEAESDNANILKENKQRKDVISTAKERYAELRKGVLITNDEISNINLPEEEFQEFLSINQQLAESFPSLATGISSSGDSIVDLGTKAEETTSKLEKMLQLTKRGEADEVKKGLSDIVDKAIIDMEDLEKETKQIQTTTENLSVFDDIMNNGTLGAKRVTIPLADHDTREVVEKVLEQAGIEQYSVFQGNGFPSSAARGLAGLWKNNIAEHIGENSIANKLFDAKQDTIDFFVTEDNIADLQEALATSGTSLYTKIQKNLDSIAANNQKIQQNYRQNVLPSLMSIFEADPTFALLNGTVGGKLDDFVNNLNAEKLLKDFRKQKKNGYKNLDEYILNDMIYPIQDAIDSGKVSEIDLSNLLNFDYDDSSVNELTEQATQIADAIFGDDEEHKEEFLIHAGVKVELDENETKFESEKMAENIFASIEQNTEDAVKRRKFNTIKMNTENPAEYFSTPTPEEWVAQQAEGWSNIWHVPTGEELARQAEENISAVWDASTTTIEDKLAEQPQLDLTLDDLKEDFDISELKLIDEAMQLGKFDFGLLGGKGLDVEGLKNWLDQYREFRKEEGIGTQTLTDVLNDETFQTDTSKTESHISALSSALDNFRESGELTTEQLHDLQKEVPELAELGDSLTMEDVGDKLWENIGDYATKFHEAMDRMDLSDEGKTQAQNFLDSFFNQFADIPVSEKNAQKALHDFFVDTEATSAETAAQRGVEENRYKKAIDALTEKYGEDIDWSVVMSI